MNIFKRTKPEDLRIPQVGDPVWWAPKRVGLSVRRVYPNGRILCLGGETIKNSKGRQVPRWSVATHGANCVWDSDLNMWILGSGQTPKIGRDQQVVYPKPVLMSGKAQGSFAVESES